ncbi:PilC/PilY family type IV pilus protein [Acinetobacter towneri]|uniref:PilC/PilY family type IV pilus protein n=1 Tax=Acinetobacter towneri TaxID=202956 RepID=UPI0020972612|nr:PilC/PilY family type IV pilus protein [Acinetobacter towneri]MCO8054921.1 PilC/PilY family type IV pilus protein [Acinetobacter towneri]
MKNINLKKLVVACQAATFTLITSVAVTTQASDIELYKAPQTSQTTLMFMLDVSGSMKGSRISDLKKGMTTLLQGDSSEGIAPLDDKLVVGLSTFNEATGRIKLEAKPLGDPVQLAGNREVFRTVQQIEQQAQRTRTRTKTDETWQERIRVRTLGWGGWSAWSDPAWTPKAFNGIWSAWVESGWSPTGSEVVKSTIAQECVDWESNYKCKANGWVATTKQAEDFVGTIPVSQTGNVTYSNQRDIATGSEPSSPQSIDPIDETNCVDWIFVCVKQENKLTQNGKKTTTTEKVDQEATASFTKSIIYTGAAYETHRKKMLQEVNKLEADDSTPTGYAYAEVAAYMMGQTTKGQTGSGFTQSSVGNIRDNDNYKKPTQIDSTKQCNTQGIYFLTDGEPQYYYNSQRSTLEDFMKKALGSKGGSFSCSNSSTLGKRSGNYSTNGTMSYPNGWDCIGAFTQALLNPDLNPSETEILTAVVGFGSDFSTGNGNDISDARDWGTLGKGGWYSGNDDKAVVDSVNAFVKKLGKYIPPVTTGSVTIPVDNLDTQNIQPWGYFPQFDPKPDAVGSTGVVTWLGNLKKYRVVDGVLKDRDSNTITNSNGLLKDDLNDYWADTSIKKTIEKEVDGVKISQEVKVGGALSRMLLGYSTAQTPNERRIFTDRTIKQNSTDNSQNDIGTISSGNLIKLGRDDFISTSSNLYKQDPKRAYLLSLFGYPVGKDLAYNVELYPKETTFQTELEQVIQQTPKRDWLMGSVMHSKPILITQEGTTKYDAENKVTTYDKRDDLIVFGTTQGLLHIVRAGISAADGDAGKEVFTFVPNEIIEKQAKGFLSQDNQSSNLQYGLDGQWTAYTEFVTKKGTNVNEPVVTVKGGKQWLYGGLRMGGKSYYALDLSDVTSSSGTPKLKFHINPAGTCSTTNALGCMGQSWSKPTLTWVNWQGKRKLVMLVGGGYDAAYESSVDYSPSNTDQGAGIYMFDADNGNLLWWASANAGSTNTATNKTYAAEMKRSVVSSIKAIDRNSDGITDHLYFGDLGGQVWRVDLNASSKAGKDENFAIRAVRILDMSGSTKVPRFYNAPNFTIHNSNNGLFAAVSIGSGNLSYPMSASTNTDDGVYVIYDKDVTRRNLAVLTTSELYTQDVKPSATGGKKLIKNTNGITKTTLTSGGWYYPLGTKKRVLNETVAIDGDLYVSIFDSSVDINDVNCAGGVRGESNAKQFCLPYGDGDCKLVQDSGSGTGGGSSDEIFLGKGNVGISFGGISRDRNIVLNLPTDKTLRTYTGKTKFVSQRWYER